MSKRKPRLTVEQARWFAEVHERVCCCDTRTAPGELWPLCEAFSDVHDGNLTPDEVRPLIRKKLLTWCPLETDGYDNGLLGGKVTVTLTERALRIFWPDRVTPPRCKFVRLSRAEDWPASLRAACDAMEAAGQKLVNTTSPAAQLAALEEFRAAQARYGKEALALDKVRRPKVYADKEAAR